MLLRMKVSRDLYYAGELVSVDEETARDYISAGVAELARCPECGGQLEATGSGVYCPECGAKK